MKEEISAKVLNIRVRNNIIEYLETVSSKDALLEYQANVPIAWVVAESFEMWSDSVHLDGQTIDEGYPNPVYTDDERTAILAYNETWKKLVDETPMTLSLEEFLDSSYYKVMSEAAKECLDIFMIKGRFSEQ
jgi:hypothetical protein